MRYGCILLCFLLFVLANLPFAQGQASSSLQGQVLDETGKPLAYATVLLLRDADSLLIKGGLSDADGRYAFGQVEAGTYRVQVSMLGYWPLSSAPIVLSGEKRVLEIPDLTLLASNIHLREATVAAARPFIERQADRMVMNIENSIVNAGNTVWEVLEKAPGVSADQNGNLSMLGKEGVLVLLDGKPTQLSGEQLAAFLRGMQSRNVESIELITNPPAKYDAAGTAGIIDIRSKRNEQDGTFVNIGLTAGAGWQERINPSFSLYYNRKRWKTFANYSYTDGGYLQRFTLNRKIRNAEQDFTFDQKDNEDYPTREHQAAIGADYAAAKNHNFGLNGRMFDRKGKLSALSTSELLDRVNDPELSYLDVLKNNETGLSNYGLNLYYRGKAGKTNWSADADYIRYDIRSAEYYQVNYRLPDEIIFREQNLRNLEDTDIEIRTAQAELHLPAGKKTALETGIKASFVTTHNSLQFDSLTNGQWQADLEKTNAFDYDETIYAAFANLQTEWHGIGLQAGLRVEHTRSTGDVATEDEPLRRRYTDFFPTLSLSIPLAGERQLGFSYSRRIDRPGYQRLNPFLFFIDPFTYAQGYPLLQPQYTDNVEVSWQARPWTLALGLSHTRDVNAFITDQIDSLLIGIASTRNLDHLYNVNLTATVQQQYTSWWSAFHFASLFYNRYRSELYGSQLDISAFALRINSSQSFSLPWKLRAEISAFYQSPSVRGISRMQAMFQCNTGLQRNFLNDRLQVKLNVNDVFNSFIGKGGTDYLNQDLHYSFRTLHSRVLLSLNYQLGNRAAGKRKLPPSGATTEEKRVIKE